MKKALSLALAAVTVAGGLVVAPSTASASYLDTAKLDEYNVAAEARYFGGNVSVWQGHGSYTDSKGLKYEENPKDPWDKYDVRTGNESKGSLLIDGKIGEGEWGDPIAVIDSKYAADNIGYKWYHSSIEYEHPSAENTYYFYNNDPTTKKSMTPDGLNFTLYMMWDEDYLYVAAHVNDADGHLGANKGAEAHNGDALQVRIDPLGPNSVVDGKGYDAKGNDRNEAYDTFIPPWKGTEYPDKRYAPCHDTVGNFVFAYVNAAGGYTEAFDASRRYNPQLDSEYKDRNDNVVPTTFYEGDDVSPKFRDVLGLGEGVHAAVNPSNKGSKRYPKWETEYEAAIPWALIGEEYKPTAGDQLGASVGLNNGKTGEEGFNAYLEWGTGVSDTHMRYSPITCGGSNCLILSDESYTTPRCNHEFTPATCIAPETCSKCGYQRGFNSSHKYEFSKAKIVSTTNNGALSAKCAVCGDSYVASVAAAKDDIKYSFKSTDDTLTGKGFNSGFTSGWKTAYDVKEKDEAGNEVDIGVNIFNPDGTTKNSFNNTKFKDENGNPIAVSDLYGDGSDVSDSIYKDPTGEKTTNNASHTGTYFDFDSSSTSYTYKMDVLFPDFNDITNHHYAAGVRNWFGNDQKYGFYGAGLYRVEGKWFFAIGANSAAEGEETTIEDFKKNVLSWAEASDEDLKTDTWHTYAFMYDDASHTAMFAWDGELKVAANDYHTGYYKSDNSANVFFRRFNIGLYVKDVEVGGVGLFGKYATAPEVPVVYYNATIGDNTEKHEAGDIVEVNAAFKVVDGKAYRFSGWTGDTNLLADANAAITTFTMPERDVTLTPEYILVGDTNDDGEVNAKDSAFIKNIIMGKADVDYVAGADINGDGAVNTKDSYLIKRMISTSYVPEA